MPKGLNLKTFARRKSSGNVLDFDAEPSAAAPQSSFRVLERPGKTPTQSAQPVRTFTSPLNTIRGKSADDLGLHANRLVETARPGTGRLLNENARGSGGTTGSGSSGYYDDSSASARYSSSSTLPSSLDQERADEEGVYPIRKSATTGMFRSPPPLADEIPPPPTPSFTTRAARALSFGQKHGRPSKDIPPVPPPHLPAKARSPSPRRERAMTTSSYASTAVPPKTELKFSSEFGTDDFSGMFESLQKDVPLHRPGTESMAFHRTDSEPMYPPRTLSRNALSSSPTHAKFQGDSPYFVDDRSSSNDGLVSTLALGSPSFLDGNTPGPAVGNGIAQAFLGASKSGYSRVPERYSPPAPERSASIDSYSSVMDDVKAKQPDFPNRQTQVDDEDRWVRRVELSDAPMPSPATAKATPVTSSTSPRQPNSIKAKATAPRPRTTSPINFGDDAYIAESTLSTPRAAKQPVPENSLFDSSPMGPASRAIRSPLQERRNSGGLKRMTKAQFQALQSRDDDRSEESEEEDLSNDDYDVEDDIERAKQMANQRRKQEANMSVYRQQMKKVTGGGPTDLPAPATSMLRPSMDRGSSAPAAAGGGGIHLGGIGGMPPPETVRGRVDDDEDDDVPLGILQAHGFPNGSRPPTRHADNDINHQRRTSTTGSVVGGGAGQGNLPPFARRLPADPYFGAGLVNNQPRESLALNNSGASVVGVPTGPMPGAPMAHPGGLVGVIAGEERARAARRGSPNPTTMAGPSMPLPGNMQMPPPMSRAMSMGNLAPPSIYGGAPPMPQMPPMPPMPQMGAMSMMGMPQMQGQQGMLDPSQQQLQQFMSMQMQLMQNMLSMQQAQMGQPGMQTPPAQQPAADYLGVNLGHNHQRPMSMSSQASFQHGPPPPNQGRSMTMLNPPTGWSNSPQGGGPRPNSAMPIIQGSYAPSVSGLNLSAGGPGPGYTPSIAPSERSNIGMPSRYRPVTQLGDPSSRTHSMTSSLTLNAFASQQTAPNPGTPFNASETHTPKSTIRVVEKPKGASRVSSRVVDEDEDDGWADMRKKREEKKKSKWLRRDKSASASTNEPSLGELYQGLD